MRDLSYITSKFYKNEEERLRKVYSKIDIIEKVGKSLKPIIQTLYMRNIRFVIFETEEDASPPIVYAGLFYCCGEREYEMVDLMTIQFVEHEIKNNTIYQKIIWEH